MLLHARSRCRGLTACTGLVQARRRRCFVSPCGNHSLAKRHVLQPAASRAGDKSTDKSFETTVDNVATEPDFYPTKLGNRPLSMEEGLVRWRPRRPSSLTSRTFRSRSISGQVEPTRRPQQRAGTAPSRRPLFSTDAACPLDACQASFRPLLPEVSAGCDGAGGVPSG